MLQKELAAASLQYLEEHHAEQKELSFFLKKLSMQWQQQAEKEEPAAIPADTRAVYKKLLQVQRNLLLEKNRKDPRIDEEIVRQFLHRIDIEEERIKLG